MLNVSDATLEALLARFSEPGYFVRIDWALPTFLCSRGDTSWAGRLWVLAPIELRGVTAGGGSIRIGNAGKEFGYQVLGEGVAGVRIRTWAYDGAATEDEDPIPIFDGFGDDAEGDLESVTIQLVTGSVGQLFAPRGYITRQEGFSIVPPDGRTVTWGGERYTFRRAR